MDFRFRGPRTAAGSSDGELNPIYLVIEQPEVLSTAAGIELTARIGLTARLINAPLPVEFVDLGWTGYRAAHSTFNVLFTRLLGVRIGLGYGRGEHSVLDLNWVLGWIICMV